MNKYNYINNLINLNKSNQAKKELSKIYSLNPKLSDLEALELASYERRISRNSEATALLYRFVRDEEGVLKKSIPEPLLLEYASNLIQSHALKEGRMLLDRCNFQTSPKKNLFYSFSYFREWDYENAYHLLKQYISHPRLSDQERRIGWINFFSTVSFLGLDEEVHQRFQEYEKEFLASEQKVLLLNLYEIYGSYFYKKNEIKFAEKYLQKATKLLSSKEDYNALYVLKWSALLELKKDRKNIQKWNAAKKLAKKLQSYETLRDLDYHRAIVKNDKKLLSYVYYGTPFLGYKSKIQTPFLKQKDPSKKLIQFEDSLSAGLKRFWFSLCEDAYAPLEMLSAFEKISQGSVYHPYSTPLQMRQFVFRLSQKIKENQLPAELSTKQKSYVLVLKNRALISPETIRERRGDLLKEFLREKKRVTPSEINQQFSLWSKSTVFRRLKSLQEEAVISSEGSGKNIIYKYLDTSPENDPKKY